MCVVGQQLIYVRESDTDKVILHYSMRALARLLDVMTALPQ